MRITIGNDIFIVSETENGYNIKSLTSDSTFDVRQGELNASIYRLMEILGIWGGKLMQNARYHVYANDICSGKFRQEQNALKCAERFIQYSGIKQVTVLNGNKIVKNIRK